VRATIRELRRAGEKRGPAQGLQACAPASDWETPATHDRAVVTPRLQASPRDAGRRLRMRAGVALAALAAATLLVWASKSGRVGVPLSVPSPPSPPPITSTSSTTFTPASNITVTPALHHERAAVVIHVDASDARIVVDGALVAQSAAGATVTVAPGEHVLTVSAPGRQRWSGRVRVDRGQTTDVAVRLHHGAAPPRAPAVAPTTDATPPPRAPAVAPTTAATSPPRPPVAGKGDPDYLVDPFGAPR
jgi:hypothetical protein